MYIFWVLLSSVLPFLRFYYTRYWLTVNYPISTSRWEQAVLPILRFCFITYCILIAYVLICCEKIVRSLICCCWYKKLRSACFGEIKSVSCLLVVCQLRPYRDRSVYVQCLSLCSGLLPVDDSWWNLHGYNPCPSPRHLLYRQKNAIFVVGGVRYLPITAEMKSYELSFGQWDRPKMGRVGAYGAQLVRRR